VPPLGGSFPAVPLPRPDASSRPDRGANVHQVIVSAEGDAPGVFQITCSCGARTWTPWGEDHAGVIAELHLQDMGITWAEFSKVRVR
jgi:hypothetical protein